MEVTLGALAETQAILTNAIQEIEQLKNMVAGG
jgi:hypothetical protein